MRAHLLRGALAALCITAPAPLAAQQRDSVPQTSLAEAVEILRAVANVSLEDLRREVRRALADPDVLNSVLEETFDRGERLRFLRDLNVRFASFEAQDSEARGLGLQYTYSHSLKREQFASRVSSASGLDFRVNANGNVAFDRRLNPRDFLDSDLSLAFFASRGGAVATTQATRVRLDSLRQALAEIESEAELESSPLLAEYMRLVLGNLTTQTYVDVAATVGIESDQSFQRKQYVYGGRVALDIKAWNPQSRLARWNLFDWPFAAIRYLNGTDSAFTVLGSNIPTVLAGFALVDPVETDARGAFGGEEAFPRLNLEVGFRTLLLESPAGPVYFQSALRWFQEVGATTALERLDADSFTYVAASLVSDRGPYVSYSKGRLPFDARKDEVYELGVRLYF